ncbi:hypothetical protein EV200_11121 [Pedobacter psychrotolerans]|uniref:Uncharacterized protein n=1 Tax=Pedobacter psychrotolerans TaxID=1843235 RepID=A0A4R2H294_9SPHI|nr:hypothetical protein [Pedobacter psychrotolerans]TCO18684.1 hypothetical protein EV200_11121 [Pedobacter psychrotolerans]GGE70018.1 hypothetical protein GCM10011413_40810 [Pedobacter psychrotolerans]
MTTKTSDQIQKGIVLDGMKAVGHGLGIHSTKPVIKKTVAKNMRLVDGLLRIAFSSRKTSAAKNKRVIELAGIGGIALYTFLRGIERKKKSLLIQGVFLGAALLTVSLATANSSSKVVRRRVH